MRYLSGLLFLCLVLVSCSSLKSSDEKVISKNFEAELYKKICEEKDNHFFSPFSIKTALAMTLEGAENNTEKQLYEVLNLNEDKKLRLENQKKLLEILNKSEKIQLDIANSIWTQNDFRFNEEYLEEIENYYKADIFDIDFNQISNSVDKINNWVSKKTNKKIDKILTEQDIDSLTKLILVNAIYFKGDWKKSFNEKKTFEGPFYSFDSKKNTVDFMYQKSKFKFYENESLKLIELPYAGEEFSMFVFLPEDNEKFGDFTSNIQRIRKFEKNLKKQKVKLYLPKFKIESSYDLGEILQEMGIIDAFSPKLADFSGIEATNSLSISKVFHKAFLEVNEKGSEAAAATVVTMKMLSVGPNSTKIFNANKPFFFYIKNNLKDEILFIGQKVK